MIQKPEDANEETWEFFCEWCTDSGTTDDADGLLWSAFSSGWEAHSQSSSTELEAHNDPRFVTPIEHRDSPVED